MWSYEKPLQKRKQSHYIKFYPKILKKFHWPADHFNSSLFDEQAFRVKFSTLIKSFLSSWLIQISSCSKRKRQRLGVVG